MIANGARYAHEIKFSIVMEKKKLSTRKRLFSPANWAYI